MTEQKTVEDQLALEVGSFYDDPLGFVMFAFPWDKDVTIQQVELQEPWASRYNAQYGPDKWACQFLDDVGKEVQKRGFDGKNSVEPIRFATASGHGIGKSTLTAWLILWIMSTRPFCKGVVTATTLPQLATKTWSELGKWIRLCATQHWFIYSSGRASMSMYQRENKETWRVDAQTSKEENSESFAGLHAANSTPFYIFDEASGVPDKIYEVRDGGLTDGEPMVYDFGNPTKNSGQFYEECVGKLAHRYNSRSIDSRDVSITNKPYISQLKEDYGEDSDRFKVRVRGIFPAQGFKQFINGDDIRACQDRPSVEDRLAPLVIGVDVARFGDNESVIYPRMGSDARSFPPRRFSGLDTIQLAGRVAETVREFQSLGKTVKSICVDATGLGGGVVDQLVHLGYPVISVHNGGRPHDPIAYRMKGDEMWGKMRDHIASGRLLLPDDFTKSGEELKLQLMQREYDHTAKGQIFLESKSDMEDRGLASPDIADALALTYAVDLPPEEMNMEFAETRFVVSEYDPLENWND